MRRNALLGLTCLLLGGCQFAGNPFDGKERCFPTFFTR